MNEKIIYPSIDLFLYDLKDGLGEDETKINGNCQDFCRKIYGDLKKASFQEKYQEFLKHKNNGGDVIELLGKAQKRGFPSPLDGYYYPLQIGDTYALQVDYSGQLDANGEPNYANQDIDNAPFKKLKEEITNRLSQQTGTIGQTWLLWGKLTNTKTETEVEEIAKECYTKIVSDYKWQRDFIGKGKFQEGTIFELWYCPQNLGVDGKEFWDEFRKSSYHILIWLFPEHISPDEMSKQVQNVYYDLLRLWQYRHKVVWSYYQSRYQKQILKKEYIEIQPSINQTIELPKLLQTNSLKLSKLQETLTNNLINLSDYTIALNYLENQSRIIPLNLENYKSHLADIEAKYTSSDLEFLKKFSESEFYGKKYQRQVEADYAILSPGLTLLQNLNNTIQGIIDLEQTKSDRTLNTTIAIAGVGLATSQIASAVILAQPNDYQQHLRFRAEVFGWSVGIGVFFAVLIFIGLRFRR
ncbi:hypothetical protein HUN01_11905 [Nostoc edaphicum CCNP1411]|uniref:Uncharacterized protein n=1 Tax=Nostoc edaphicum CCNP1411 TaxID=1472755 RepID=A0A7D7QS15_9NOSO|nr:hypothetical protein [Nostoc edaphicum]QMS88263.1 hypothetical protein HUN01_11905 [Nostoc edaphicum CCNP1411]